MSAAGNIPERVLSDLIETKGIDSSAIASLEGTYITSNLDKEDLPEVFTILSRTILGMSTNADNRNFMDMPDKMILGSDHGKLIAVRACPQAVIMALTREETLGPILDELEKAANQLKYINCKKRCSNETGHIRNTRT